MDLLKEKTLHAHALKLWGILNRTRGKDPDLRRSELAKAESWLLEQKLVKPEHVRIISRATIELFSRAEESGEIDTLIVPGFGAGKRTRAEDSRQLLLHRYQSARNALVERLWEETKPIVASEGVTGRLLLLYRQLVVHCCYLVDHYEPGSKECTDGVEEYVTNERHRALGLDPALARRLAAAALPRYEELRKELPPDPRGWTRPSGSSPGA